jgi:hypothetical protein
MPAFLGNIKSLVARFGKEVREWMQGFRSWSFSRPWFFF